MKRVSGQANEIQGMNDCVPAFFSSMDQACTAELVRLPFTIVLLEIEAAQHSPSNARAACLCPYAYVKGLKEENDGRRVAMQRLNKVITRMRLRRQGHLAFIRFEAMGPPIPVTFLLLQASWRWA